MRPGILNLRDPFIMDPSLLMDPNIFDYGSSSKDDFNINFCDPILFDWVNSTDSQLESFILNSELCGELENLSFSETELFEDNFQGSIFQVKQEFGNKVESDTVHCNVDGEVANYEEIITTTKIENQPGEIITTTKIEDQPEENIEEPEFCLSEDESVNSFITVSSEGNIKRKYKSQSTCGPTKKRKVSKRGRRVQDERIKNQNKIAAMKYRMKKRIEHKELEQILLLEKDRNNQLKTEIKELQTNIKVIKELLKTCLPK